MPKRHRLVWIFALAAATLLLAANLTLSLSSGDTLTQGNGIILESPPYMGDITLTSAGGRRVTLASLEAPYLVVFFGYTSCPDVCPLTMAVLAEAYRNLGEPPEIQVVMVTVDPAVDTPERTQSYAETFHPEFLGLSGTNSEIAAAASRFFIAVNNTGGNRVGHSDPIAVLDQQRNMRVIYTQDAMHQLERHLKAVLSDNAW